MKKFADKQKKLGKILIILFLLGLFLFSFYIFYMQINGSEKGYFESDLPMHISMGVTGEDRYNIVYFILKILWLFDSRGILISFFLATVFILTIIFTGKLISYYVIGKSKEFYGIAAIVINLCMSVYVPFLNKYHYLSNVGPLLLHNSTYLCMKLMAVIVMLFFCKLRDGIWEKIDWKNYIIFTVSMTAMNMMKPSFFMCFAPAAFVELIFCALQKKNGGKIGIKRVIIYLSSVFPSVVILGYQYFVLFIGSDNGSKMGIDFGYALLQWADYPVISIFQTFLLPFFVLITNFQTIINEFKYRVTYEIGFWGLTEYLFLIEDGVRKDHLNWIWGYASAIFFSYVGAYCCVFEHKGNKRNYMYIFYVILLLHLASGIIYFLNIFSGRMFW